MMLFKALDVAIGVVFLFLLLTFLASALVEIISTIANWRAQLLNGAINNMLQDSSLVTGEDVYKDPLVVALGRNNAARSWIDLFERFGWHLNKTFTQPSYIPAAVFSTSILQNLGAKTQAPPDLSPEGTIKMIRDMLAPSDDRPAAIKGDALRSILEVTLATQGASVQAVKLALEKWYNDTMDRVSGWYKRRTQACLLVIGLIFALAGNIDTIAVSLWLWQGDAARQTLVSAAANYVKDNHLPIGPLNTGANKDETSPNPKTLADLSAQVISIDRILVSREYPIGWPHVASGPLWFFQYLIGALVTAIAISMGSSFWFDTLQNLINIRGTGAKPGAR